MKISAYCQLSHLIRMRNKNQNKVIKVGVYFVGIRIAVQLMLETLSEPNRNDGTNVKANFQFANS